MIEELLSIFSTAGLAFRYQLDDRQMAEIPISDQSGRVSATAVVEMLFKSSEPLWRYIQGAYLPRQEIIRDCAVGEGDLTKVNEIGRTTIKFAHKHGHAIINEFHIFRSIIELRPTSVQVNLAPLAKIYAEQYPAGNPVVMAAISSLPSQQKDLRDKMLASTLATPFSLESIIKKTDAYLSSEFYPFTEMTYSQFIMRYPQGCRLSASDAAAQHAAWSAFRCHRIGLV